VSFQVIFRSPLGATIVAAIAAMAIAACGGGGGNSVTGGNCAHLNSYGGGGGGGSSGTCAQPAASAQPVGVMLTGETPVTTTSDGTVLGYFNGTNGNPPSGSGAVTLTASTNVQFHNVDPSQPHTASNLGAYSGTYPSSFTNTNGTTASAAGVSIGSANFSTGTIAPAGVSAVYSTGGAGMFVFGCAFHYVSNNMRTVIIVE
jgi:hypothetical protein